MPDPITTPPAAPTSTPPTPTPAPTQSPPPPSPGGGDENPFAEADAPFEAARAKVEAQLTPPQPPAKPAAGKPSGKPAPAKGGGTSDPAGAAPPPAAPAGGPKELRAQLEKVNQDLAARNKAYAEMEAKIADFEKRGKDTEALQTRLQQMEKAIQEREAEIRAFRVEASEQFKKTFDVPFQQAVGHAKADVEQLNVRDPESGETRKATWGDFAGIYAMPLQKAIETANTMFGPAAQLVLQHFTQLKNIDQARAQAIADERAHAAERNEAEKAAWQTHQEQLNTSFEKANKDLVDKFEQYRDPPEDTELSEARKKGYAAYDRAPQTWQQRVVKDAHIRQRVAAFGPNQILIARLRAELAELKAKGTPGKVVLPVPGAKGGGEVGVPPEDSWEEGARKATSNA